MFRHIRERRNHQAAQREYEELTQTAHLVPALDEIPDFPETDAAQDAEQDFLPRDLRVPPRDQLAGLMMRWDKPLVVEGEVRTCPECGAYRAWVVFLMRESIWLRCPAGHETLEPRLDAAWYNRNSGPLTSLHDTVQDGLKHLGH
ncbi:MULTISPECIES: hypothetical protein [unclassified Streptomyces]|uniref:hypothetical protein n=1 Tax=unclassified Streptomyces TaxID=2593676 RepID=UPI0021AD76EF|nr:MULTISPECIES: hypothetical protein [unclassified Streptomyces]